jgi:hypothetical protein
MRRLLALAFVPLLVGCGGGGSDDKEEAKPFSIVLAQTQVVYVGDQFDVRIVLYGSDGREISFSQAKVVPSDFDVTIRTPGATTVVVPNANADGFRFNAVSAIAGQTIKVSYHDDSSIADTVFVVQTTRP